MWRCVRLGACCAAASFYSHGYCIYTACALHMHCTYCTHALHSRTASGEFYLHGYDVGGAVML